MASFFNSLICAAAALLIYAGLGLPLALRIAPRPLALMLAPALGWAVHSALALPSGLQGAPCTDCTSALAWA